MSSGSTLNGEAVRATLDTDQINIMGFRRERAPQAFAPSWLLVFLPESMTTDISTTTEISVTCDGRS